jgi:hypothetical protein
MFVTRSEQIRWFLLIETDIQRCVTLVDALLCRERHPTSRWQDEIEIDEQI